MKSEFELSSLDSFPKLIEAFIETFKECKIICLSGPLGAGKTTFVQQICGHWNVEDFVSSPTFSLVNEYYTDQGKVYHLDLYRLESLEEALNMGIEEILGSDCWCFIEWPSLLEPILPIPHGKIEFEHVEKSKRKVVFWKEQK